MDKHSGHPAPHDSDDDAAAMSSHGQIVLAATPLGNLGDATTRLRELLAGADVIAAEDTRTVHRLAQALGVHMSGKVVSHHEHNEAQSAPELVKLAQHGATVAVVSDAGMPLVSDPGFRLVQLAAEAGVPVTSAPGASAVTTALALSGISPDRFAFEGFLPRKGGERRRLLQELAQERRTLVFFESPHRLAATLADFAEHFGADRQGCVARELTKLHEEVVRDSLGQLTQWAESKQIRGEIVIVVAGQSAQEAALTQPSEEELIEQVEHLVAAGIRLKDATKQVAATQGMAPRQLYNHVIAARSS